MTTNGESGAVAIRTGEGQQGSGGDISLTVGVGNSGDGGDVLVTAGATTDAGTVGGAVVIKAGNGTNTDGADGGDGGRVQITAGAALGSDNDADVGGDLVFDAGYAAAAEGGHVKVTSGFSEATSRGAA